MNRRGGRGFRLRAAGGRLALPFAWCVVFIGLIPFFASGVHAQPIPWDVGETDRIGQLTIYGGDIKWGAPVTDAEYLGKSKK